MKAISVYFTLTYLIIFSTLLKASTLSKNNCALEYYGESGGFQERVMVTCKPKKADINNCTLNIASDRNIIFLSASKITYTLGLKEEIYYNIADVINTDATIKNVRHKIGRPYSPTALNYIENKVKDLCIDHDYRNDPVVTRRETKSTSYSATGIFSQCYFSSVKEDIYPSPATHSTSLALSPLQILNSLSLLLLAKVFNPVYG